MRFLKTIVVTSLCFVAIAPSRVLGGLVTWQFAGEITSVVDPEDRLGGTIAVGSPFSGLVTFDPATIDTHPDNPGIGIYDGAVVQVLGEVAGLAFSAPTGLGGRISVFDRSAGVGSDSLSIHVADINTPFLGETSDFLLGLRDTTGAAFVTDSLPLFTPDLSSFDLAPFSLVSASELVGLHGTVTLLIPEPVTLVLVSLGALLVLRRRFRRSGRTVGSLVVLALGILFPGAPVQGEWAAGWGPVVIGGDDTDHHFPNSGELYMREAFNFLGAQVMNGNTMAVCIGCNAENGGQK